MVPPVAPEKAARFVDGKLPHVVINAMILHKRKIPDHSVIIKCIEITKKIILNIYALGNCS